MIDIIIFTYNRAPRLKKTLDTIFQSERFWNRLYVVNNASTDETSDLCRQFGDQLTEIKHRYNIGISGNLLRSWEIGDSDYFWLLCDDDHYDLSPSQTTEVTRALRELKPDLTYVSHMSRFGEVPRGEFFPDASEAIANHEFFEAAAFPSSFIVKRSLLQSIDIYRGYMGTYFLYPYAPFFCRLCGEKFSLYTMPKPLVQRDPHEEINFPTFTTQVGWMIMTQYAPERYWKYSLFAIMDPHRPFRTLAGCITRQRLDFNRPTLYENLCGITLAPKPVRGLFLRLLPLSLCPKGVLVALRKLFSVTKDLRYGRQRQEKRWKYETNDSFRA